MSAGAGSQPLLQRPAVSDVTFEPKSGRTPEGWPLEQIKAGSLAGLAAYACFYATRKRRPHLMGRDQHRIGLDADYCAIFWNELAPAAGVPALFSELHNYLEGARAAEAAGGARGCVPLTVLDGILVVFELSRRHLLWQSPHNRVQLLAHGRLLAEDLAAALRLQQGGATAEEEAALESLEIALAEAGKAVDVAASVAAISVPATNRVVLQLLGEVCGPDGLPVPVHTYARAFAPADGAIERLWDASPADIGAQWTHMELQLFQNISVPEILAAGWDQPRFEHVADSARAMVEHFNAATLWVTAEVLAPGSTHERAAVIARWIQVACALRRLNNFAGVFAIAFGLRRDIVARLAATWALVPALAQERWVSIRELTDDKHNYRAYRDALRALEKGAPLVPHLGAHTAEITLQDQRLTKEVPGHLESGPKFMNFRRYRELHGMLLSFIAMQERTHAPEQIGPVLPRLLNMLSSALRPYYFYFEDDREKAVARFAVRSGQLEPSGAAGVGGDVAAGQGR